MQGTAALAVPVRDAHGEMIAASSVAALRERRDRPRLAVVLAAMQRQAISIGRRHDEVHAARSRAAPRSR
jgi:DNA-binding IclR family transcriptional regulator